ncbi:MAG: hypothetical protein KME15_04580 [Drouetiella hepatica Uher 2000/2452]|jgi:hypothetical protein|uniref:Uncharacterized protein n=1 Tax=Drouetiella hepatica Uher 2000/2452 TaxID=904376 RepID=A0A951Q735_9CYAN|nr:hypothetical protein [Drouetiella hepatica Uher 2000/2452]
MKLQLDTRTAHIPASVWENLSPCSDVVPSKIESSTWVKLLHPPTAFSFDEAWLLCQVSESQWLGWIPDYGEMLLNLDEFAMPV